MPRGTRHGRNPGAQNASARIAANAVPIRSRAFEARQEDAHLDRLTREAKERADALATIFSDMDKEDALASHTVPALVKLS